jgi:hypothetical protein
MAVSVSRGGFGRRLAILAALAMLASACSGIDLQSAQKLGSAGTKLSTSMRDEAKSVVEEIKLFDERNTLIRVSTRMRACIKQATASNPCRLHPDSIDLPDNTDRLAKITTALQERADALGTLTEAYAGFEALASYKAAEEAEKSVGNLINQTNSFIGVINAIPVPGTAAIPLVSATIGEIAKVGAGLVAEERHKKQVLAASRAIQTAVAALKAAIDKEKTIMASIRVTNTARREVLRQVLMDEGAIGYASTLDPIIRGIGSEPVPDLEKAIGHSAPLKGAINRIISLRAERQDKEVAERYNDLLNGLTKLIVAHEKLQEEKAPDLAELQYWAKRIEGYYKRIRDAE